mgnify:CR=1 FL=1
MNFLTAIIDGLVRFVQRNPLTTLVILILAVGAPALLRGIALFFLYFIMGVIVLVVAAMEEQFGEGNFGGQGFGSPFAGEPRKGREGEVKVYKTSETPEKRVSRDVGDYVEFEETKEPGEE